ncbi:pentatricopeptide repeat-containing protein 2, mitochondrial-like [Contarinia nasturtii]|uniref:pentatricopeptide repeat-containing protein 2, mitochondrial-like n=1 Tax=Contarinia nasturtii TaxID=265458 RepID=UPI0012D40F89|nr:pentatricopeptide repeat-containing protein 2, mitochondrial-like [Contarinia nasturtii]
MECLLFIRDNPHPDPTKKFTFGPVVMRMLHSLNMSHEAINIAHNFETADIFDEASSPIILCDLLFNNGMYNEVLRVVQRKKAMNEKRDMKTTHLLNCITFATCYKLNTQDHLSFALEIWNKSVKEHQLSEAFNFLCMNAVNLDQAKIALDILPANDSNFAEFVLSDCGKYAEATQVIICVLRIE